jgi:P4 family phage/plasmid primase-like protien
MIPKVLCDTNINFVLLEKSGKKPFQIGWQKKQIKFNDEELQQNINKGNNYGVMGGGEKHLVLIDFDNQALQDKLEKELPETFTVKTGSGKHHLYYFSDKAESFKIFDEEMNTAIDIQGEGKQVVGPGSTHPNGNKYEVLKDLPISFLAYAEIKARILPLDKKPKKVEEPKKEYLPKDENDFIEVIKNRVRLSDVLREVGIDTRFNPTNCCFHDSKGGKCFGWNENTWHCFHCDEKGNLFSLAMKYYNKSFKEILLWFADKFNLQEEHDRCKKAYFEKLKQESKSESLSVKYTFLEMISEKEKNWPKITEFLVNHIKSKNNIYTTKEDVKSEVWIYVDGVYVAQGRSAIKKFLRDLLEEHYSDFIFNKVMEKIEPDTFIESNAFFNSNHKEELPVLNGVLNINTNELSEFTPSKIFFNKINVKYDPEAKCPKIETFLKDVLAHEEDVKVFYELVGFCLLKEYTYEKAFMLNGRGRNGKGKALEIIRRFLGMDNVCSLTLSSLDSESFSISELFGKLVNIAGDIASDDLKDTSMFKALTGRDSITAKRKFLSSLHFQNYAKFVFSCNELPMVYDFQRGFWDRWITLNFPYTFVYQAELDEAKDKTFLKLRKDNIIDDVCSPEEFSGLLNEALAGLKRLAVKGFSFTKGCDEVKSEWIRKSNSFYAFAIDILKPDSDKSVSKQKLRKAYVDYCAKHSVTSKSDFVIKKVLTENFGVSEERKYLGDISEYVWVGVDWK